MLNRVNLAKSDKGTAMIIFTLCLTLMLGLSALVVDVGTVAYEKSRLSNAVDAAALAGAQELIYDKDNAEAVAHQYLEENNVDPLDAEVVLFDSDTKISITVNKDVNYHFAKIFGLYSDNVKTVGVAQCAPVVGVYNGVRPFAIEDQPLNFGQTYTLKEGGGDGSDGNYGGIVLGSSGANSYVNNIIGGYNGHLRVGDYIDTEPGNMSGPTLLGITELINQCNHIPECNSSDYNKACPRLITITVVDSLDVNGRSSVKIVGFAKFFLEGVAGQGNESIVSGKFVQSIIDGDISETQTDYGLKGVRLIQ